MATKLRQKQDIFSKVKIARQVLKEKAEEILAEYLDVVEKAKDSGDYETAAKSLQWLIEHIPADDDGDRIVDVGIDKKQQTVEKGSSGPAIQVGIMLGGTSHNQKILPMPKPSDIPIVAIVEPVRNEPEG